MSEYTYRYPRPSVTVDLVVFVLEDDELRVLMIRRKKDPFEGSWAIPGGFMNMEEDFETAARRELKEETGLEIDGPIDFFGVFGKPGRDPRGRTISIAHATAVRSPAPKIKGSDDAAAARWLKLDEIDSLAFDHEQIIESALSWVVERALGGPVGLALLPKRFRFDDVAKLHRAVLKQDDDAEAWLKWLVEHGMVRALRRPKETFTAETTKSTRSVRYSAPFFAPTISAAGPLEPD